MESVYLETTFVSYLVARPSRDLLVAAHQQATHDWWTYRRGLFACCAFQVVIDEAAQGDPLEAHKRLTILAELPSLSLVAAAETLTESIMAARVLPEHAARDAAHIAVAAAHAIDYLLTWNCKHLANAQIARRIARVCAEAGYRMPIICTPEELMGG